MSAMMRGMEMQELTNEELEGVSGGGDGQACAVAMIAAGFGGARIGQVVGALGGPGGALIGFGVGALIGGGLAAAYYPACQSQK